jgi:predicted amidohydrolase YtcJ
VRADRLIVGRIATLAGPRGWGWVEAIAVAGARVAAAGMRGDVQALVGRSTRTWTIPPDHVVVPGITDAHLHLGDAARAASELDLTGLDRTGVQDAIAGAHRRRLAEGDADGWLTGHGWSMEGLGGRPHASLLDAVAPGRPIALWAHDHHARWLSGEALRQAGIVTAGPTGPTGGIVVRDDDGAPTGLLLEGAAVLVDPAIPPPTEEKADRALAACASSLHALGVTGVHDPGEITPDPRLRAGPTRYRRLAEEGRLPLRVVACIRREQLDAAIASGFRTGRPATARGDAPPRYRDGWLKLFADGSLGSRSASLLAPYEADDPLAPAGSARGMALLGVDEIGDLARRAAAHAIASQVHAIGDAAVRAALDALADVPRVGSARHRVEHAQLVDETDAPRFGALGIAASVQACHLLSDAPAIRRAWGDRSARAFALADLARGGALLPLGTDSPVEPADPWRGIVAAVARRGVAWPRSSALAPEQAIDLPRALRAACLDGPRSLGLDDQGHLGPGAVADLIVVPAAPLDDPSDLAGLGALRPSLTLIDGAVVHGSPPGE